MSQSINTKLEQLVSSGMLSSYSIKTLDAYGDEVEQPGNGERETDCLILEFPNGKVLTINTFCSGCAENTSLDFS